MAEWNTPEQEAQINEILKERDNLDARILKRGKAHHTQTTQRIKLNEQINEIEYKGSQVQKDVFRTITSIEKKNRKVLAQGKDKYGQQKNTLDLSKRHLKNLDSKMRLGQISRDVGKELVELNEDVISGHMTLEGIQSKRAEIEQTIVDRKKEAVEGGRAFTKEEEEAYREGLNLLESDEKRLSTQRNINAAKTASKNLIDKIGSAIGISMLNPLTMAVGILEKFNETQKAIGDKFGAMGVVFFKKELVDAQVEFTKMGLTADDAFSSIATLGNEFGISTAEAAKLSAHVSDLAKSTGLAVDESAKLLGFLTETQSLTGEQANDLVKSATMLAKANKVAPDAVLRDIAQNTEVFAKFADKGGKNVLRAAIQAKKLGIGLDKVASAAEGLMDFQSSLNAEVEASIMLGRQVNLQKAREAALTNDLTGMQKEIMKQVGSEAEFNKLNLLQRRALAKAVGMEVADLTKLVSKQEESVSLQGELAKQNISKLVPKEVMTQMAELMHSMAALGVVLAEVLGPPLEMVVGLFSGFLSSMQQGIKFVTDYALAFGVLTLAVVAYNSKAILTAAIKKKEAISSAISLAFKGGIPGPVGIAMALAASLAAIGFITSQIDDGLVGPGGETLISGPKGTVQVNKDDSMLVGTNLFGGNGNGGGNNLDTKKNVQATKENTEETKGLRRDLYAYFGPGGSVAKDTANKFGSKLEDLS